MVKCGGESIGASVLAYEAATTNSASHIKAFQRARMATPRVGSSRSRPAILMDSLQPARQHGKVYLSKSLGNGCEASEGSNPALKSPSRRPIESCQEPK